MKERCDVRKKERERERERDKKKKRQGNSIRSLFRPMINAVGAAAVCVRAVGETLKNCYFCIPSNFRGLSSFKKNP